MRLRLTDSPFYVFVHVISPDQLDLNQLEKYQRSKADGSVLKSDGIEAQVPLSFQKKTSANGELTHFKHIESSANKRLHSCDKSDKSSPKNKLSLSADTYTDPATLYSENKRIPFPEVRSEIHSPYSPLLKQSHKKSGFYISDFRTRLASKRTHLSKEINTEIFGAFCANGLPHK